MPFVHMPDNRRKTEGQDDAHAPDAQQDFLAEPYLLVAAVEPGRQLSIGWSVIRDVRVNQVEDHASNPRLPHEDMHDPVPDLDGDATGCARWSQGLVDGRLLPVEGRVFGFLPAFWADPLTEVSLWVHETKTDERDPEVARFLAVVTCKDTQAATVYRDRVVKSELRREIGDPLV